MLKLKELWLLNNPTLLFLQGRLNFESFTRFCKQYQIDPEKTVFIFPGNPSHHSANQTLYSKKAGGGLAHVAYELGEHGIPTLSLPTTGMNGIEDDKSKLLAEHAVADLWRAVGFGLNIALPVRSQTNNQYFDNRLMNCNEKLEPSFWGGIETISNKSLGNYYLEQLNLLSEFLKDGKSHSYQEFLHEGEVARSLMDSGQQPSAWFRK